MTVYNHYVTFRKAEHLGNLQAMEFDEELDAIEFKETGVDVDEEGKCYTQYIVSTVEFSEKNQQRIRKLPGVIDYDFNQIEE